MLGSGPATSKRSAAASSRLVPPTCPRGESGGEKSIEAARPVTIMNCVGNHLSLFLQRIYSENSPQNCNATRSARCARQTAFAASHYPLPTAGLFRTRHRSNMQCENGNFKVFGAAALNTSFRIDIWNERSISGARAVWSVAGECRWSGRQRRCRGSPSECDRRGRAQNLWR